MNTLMVILLGVMLSCLLVCCKIENACKNQLMVLTAINEYLDDTGEVEMALHMIGEMEGFFDTVVRFWDWGYTNILPKQYFELIKPYIK